MSDFYVKQVWRADGKRQVLWHRCGGPVDGILTTDCGREIQVPTNRAAIRTVSPKSSICPVCWSQTPLEPALAALAYRRGIHLRKSAAMADRRRPYMAYTLDGPIRERITGYGLSKADLAFLFRNLPTLEPSEQKRIGEEFARRWPNERPVTKR